MLVSCQTVEEIVLAVFMMVQLIPGSFIIDILWKSKCTFDSVVEIGPVFE